MSSQFLVLPLFSDEEETTTLFFNKIFSKSSPSRGGGVSAETVVHFVDRVLLEQLPDAFFVFIVEFALGESDVERDVESSEQVVVLVVGHPLALLPDPGSRPGDLVPSNGHLMTILWRNIRIISIKHSPALY